MKYILVYILVFLSLFEFKAQVRFNNHTSIGNDTLFDDGTKVIQTKLKQYVSCGITLYINYQAAYLIKTDSLGNCIWKKQYDFAIGKSDFFEGIIELPDSNYLLLGITTNTATNDDDIFLAKIDTGGNVIWFKKYMHPDDDEATDFKLTPDGNIIIVGYSFNSGSSDDVVLIKTDINGNLLWRKRFGDVINWDKYYTIDVIKNNTEYILGGEYGYYNTGNPFFDMSIMRTDTAGNPLWQQQYGIANIDDTGKGGVPTLDSGYALYGQYNGNEALLKVDKNGLMQWVKNYGYNNNAIISQAKQLTDSSYVLMLATSDTETMSFTGRLVKTDKNGDAIWKRIYSPYNTSAANYFFGFNTTSDGGFIITGEYGYMGQPYQNMWLVKTDSLGCDSTGGCSYLPTGIKENSSIANTNNFKIYPNPNNGTFKILCDVTDDVNDKVVTINITNIVGQVIYTVNELNNTNVIELNNLNLNKGIYIVTIMQKHGVLGQSKLIIE